MGHGNLTIIYTCIIFKIIIEIKVIEISLRSNNGKTYVKLVKFEPGSFENYEKPEYLSHAK